MSLDSAFYEFSFGILYVLFPMATPFQLLMELQRQLADLQGDIKTTFQDFKVESQINQERYIMETIYKYITSEYTQVKYAWYDYEDECDDWYMDNFIYGMTTTFIFYMMTLLHLV
jgi:hypothetical protein